MRRQKRCSFCDGFGHTKPTCKSYLKALQAREARGGYLSEKQKALLARRSGASKPKSQKEKKEVKSFCGFCGVKGHTAATCKIKKDVSFLYQNINKTFKERIAYQFDRTGFRSGALVAQAMYYSKKDDNMNRLSLITSVDYERINIGEMYESRATADRWSRNPDIRKPMRPFMAMVINTNESEDDAHIGDRLPVSLGLEYVIPYEPAGYLKDGEWVTPAYAQDDSGVKWNNHDNLTIWGLDFFGRDNNTFQGHNPRKSNSSWVVSGVDAKNEDEMSANLMGLRKNCLNYDGFDILCKHLKKQNAKRKEPLGQYLLTELSSIWRIMNLAEDKDYLDFSDEFINKAIALHLPVENGRYMSTSQGVKVMRQLREKHYPQGETNWRVR